MRELHSNKDRVIVQITEGKYAGMVMIIKDGAIQYRNIPGMRNSTRKLLEYDDYFEANDIITDMKSIRTPEDIIRLNDFIEKMNQPKQYPF